MHDTGSDEQVSSDHQHLTEDEARQLAEFEHGQRRMPLDNTARDWATKVHYCAFCGSTYRRLSDEVDQAKRS